MQDKKLINLTTGVARPSGVYSIEFHEDEHSAHIKRSSKGVSTTHPLATSQSAESGYSHTGAFAGKPLSNNYVWEAGVGINYTQNDVNNDTYKVFSLDRDVHLAVDNPYWSTPTPSGVTA